LARIAGLLTPAPSAPCSDAWTMLSTSESSRSEANAFSVLPLVVSVQISSFLPQSAGTRTLNTNRLRRGWKCVGCPWSGAPGEMLLSGPIGTSGSSSQFRFMYPNIMLNEPSSFFSQPSKAGETVCPLE
jgi:hypothetical protein